MYLKDTYYSNNTNNYCDQCKHNAVCKWRLDANKLKENLSKIIMAPSSPLRIDINCVHYEHQPTPNSSWRSAFKSNENNL